jgi:hypothetical protein
VTKLGQNHGRYLGETIDIGSVLRQINIAAQTHGWTSEPMCEIEDFPILAWHRRATGGGHLPVDEGHSIGGDHPPCRIYLSAGIHGDEPAGPLAALRLLQENPWPKTAEIFLVPCLNPLGFTLNQRENADGIDLNRDYRTPKTIECRTHIEWSERQPPFDIYFCLHEDWESRGFYLYEQNPEDRPSLAEAMVEAVRKVCPIDMSETIEDRPANGGIIRPLIKIQDRPDWPEAFYLLNHKSRQGYTLEAPSDFPLPTRINALVAAISAALPLVTANP